MSSHQHSQNPRALCGLFSLVLPDKIRRILTSTHKRRVTINILPDDVLLFIFHFDRLISRDEHKNRKHWRRDRLVYVCRRWRSVVFASPEFLDVQLLCNPWAGARVTGPGARPHLPVAITNLVYRYRFEYHDLDPAIMPLRINRVRSIHWDFTSGGPSLQKFASAMQEELPALTHLMLSHNFRNCHISGSPTAPTLPDGFLGGSAPRLQNLELDSVPFPALPKLLLSATDLVRLALFDIPYSGYISPDAIVTGLAALVSLKLFIIEFKFRRSLPDQQSGRTFPLTRTVLPTLTRLVFHGVSEYLDDIVARIDAPLLDSISITLFHQPIFEIPQLAQFMGRTTRFQALNKAHVVFRTYDVQVGYLPQPKSGLKTRLKVSCGKFDWQLLSVPQVSRSFFPSTHMVEHLYIDGYGNMGSRGINDIEKMQWLGLFHPFSGVKNLYVSMGFARQVAPALQELVEGRMTGALPTLQNIYLEGLHRQRRGGIPEGIEKFAAARQRSGHPITVSRWERSRSQ